MLNSNLTTKLRSLLRPQRATVLVLIILGFLASLSEGIGIGLFIPFLQTFDVPSASAAQSTWLGETLAGFFNEVPMGRRTWVIAAAIFSAVSIKALLTFVTAYLFAKLSAKTGHAMRTQIFEKAMTIDFGTLYSIGAAKFLNVLSNESWRATDASTQYVQVIITTCTLLVY